MDSSARPIGLVVRVVALGVFASLVATLITTTQLYATGAIAIGLLAIGFAELVRYATAGDRETLRVIESIGWGDIADRAMPKRAGPVASALNAALDRLRARSAQTEAESAAMRTVVEHAPVPLLTIEADGQVELLNRAARRLFDGVTISQAEHLLALSPELARLLRQPGRQVVTLDLPGGQTRCLLSVATSLRAGRATTLVSLQNVQTELCATETRAWEELVRVLAHEMMNSLTPVSSLAQTSAMLIEDLAETLGPDRKTDMAELHEAIDAIARRSSGLMRFIDGYRRFAEPPTPELRLVSIAQTLERTRTLAAGLPGAQDIEIAVAVQPPGLSFETDPDLLDQMLINLVKNAVEAVRDHSVKRITLSADLDLAGRPVLSVADSGPGLSKDTIEHLFVPFFTTKEHGSGIGLSLVRQIMLALGGTVAVASDENGAIFRLTF
jgi:two-component system nitrogen regulation sensor histidine kinase NtrY